MRPACDGMLVPSARVASGAAQLAAHLPSAWGSRGLADASVLRALLSPAALRSPRALAPPGRSMVAGMARCCKPCNAAITVGGTPAGGGSAGGTAASGAKAGGASRGGFETAGVGSEVAIVQGGTLGTSGTAADGGGGCCASGLEAQRTAMAMSGRMAVGLAIWSKDAAGRRAEAPRVASSSGGGATPVSTSSRFAQPAVGLALLGRVGVECRASSDLWIVSRSERSGPDTDRPGHPGGAGLGPRDRRDGASSPALLRSDW